MEHEVSNNNKKIKMVLRLFPYLRDKEKAENLLIDDESIYYISVREYAEKTTEIIKHHLIEIGKNNPQEIIITDAMGGVGGNTISFAKNFKFVYSIEFEKERAMMMKNNIRIYNCHNIKVVNDDCMNILKHINNHDVIFLDPPWGGSDYKNYDLLRLKINNEPIENICNRLSDSRYMKKIPSMIVLKLPKNYDIKNFYYSINNKKIYYYNLKKMIILVLLTKFTNIE